MFLVATRGKASCLYPESLGGTHSTDPGSPKPPSALVDGLCLFWRIRVNTASQQASIERLRASRDTLTARRISNAETEGTTWALSADYEELERVAGLVDNPLVSYEGEAVDELGKALTDDECSNVHDMAENIVPIFGRRRPSDDEARAFINGAAAVFAEV